MPLKVRLVVRTAHGGCTTLKWNRRRDVGQAGSLRGGWLPPLSAAIAAGGRLTIGRSLPSCPTGAPPAWRTTYAQLQALLLMNRVDVHFCGARPLAFGCWLLAQPGARRYARNQLAASRPFVSTRSEERRVG